jgi:peptidyl-prolyl cis-trans isomerase A (cyclophilin A)
MRTIRPTLRVVLTLLAWCLGLVAERASAETIVNPVVRFTILGGNFVDVELFQDVVPLTVANFLSYVDDGSYTNTFFNRSRNQFQPNDPPYTPSGINILQAGGFTVTTTQQGLVINPVTTGSAIPLEALLPNTAGTIAMARGRLPNTATNQWFFNLTDNPSLDPNQLSDGYAVFGRVISGMNVLYAIADLPTTDFNGTLLGVDTTAPTYAPDEDPFGYVPMITNSQQNTYFVTIDSIAPVPEPSTLVLAGVGLAAAAFTAARRSRRVAC